MGDYAEGTDKRCGGDGDGEEPPITLEEIGMKYEIKWINQPQEEDNKGTNKCWGGGWQGHEQTLGR